MPAYYPDDEEEDLAVPERGMEEDYLPTQAQAIALDQQLSQQLPQPNFDVPASLMRGEANKEFYSGRPGLFVQGGPSVPAGMIQVNGQLERSQAAPQPIPWWITQADEFKEQRRQEDFLRGLMSQSGKSGPEDYQRMKQIQGQMQLQADVKAGMPFRDAVIKNAANLYAGARGPLTALALAKGPPQPITAPRIFQTPQGTFYESSPGRVSQATPLKAPSEDASVAQKLAYWSHRITALSRRIESASQLRDKTEFNKAKADEAEALAEVNNLLKRKGESSSTQAAPAATQAQMGARSTLANQLVKEHPEWSDAQIFSEVKKRLNLK